MSQLKKSLQHVFEVSYDERHIVVDTLPFAAVNPASDLARQKLHKVSQHSDTFVEVVVKVEAVIFAEANQSNIFIECSQRHSDLDGYSFRRQTVVNTPAEVSPLLHDHEYLPNGALFLARVYFQLRTVLLIS